MNPRKLQMETCRQYPAFHILKRLRLSLMLMLAPLLLVATARAGEAILSFSGIGGYVNGTAGFTFQPQQNISVTALGAFDITIAGSGPTSVGLWGSDGTLLASSLITASSVLFDQTRFEPIVSVDLWAGKTYTLGAYAQSGTTIVIGVTPVEGYVTTAPEIRMGAAVTGVGFTWPTTSAGPEGSAILGPNIQFVVPEPSSITLLCFGGLAVLIAKKGRRSAVA